MKYIKLFEDTTEIPRTGFDVNKDLDNMVSKVIEYLDGILSPFDIDVFEGGSGFIIEYDNDSAAIPKGQNRHEIVFHIDYQDGYLQLMDENEHPLDLENNIVEYLIDNNPSLHRHLIKDEIFINAIENDPNNFKYYKDIFDDLSAKIQKEYAYLKNELF